MKKVILCISCALFVSSAYAEPVDNKDAFIVVLINENNIQECEKNFATYPCFSDNKLMLNAYKFISIQRIKAHDVLKKLNKKSITPLG